SSSGDFFENLDDLGDFASHLTQDGNYWLSIDQFDFAERYKKLEVELVIKLGVGLNGDNFHFVFRAVPLKLLGHAEVAVSPNSNVMHHLKSPHNSYWGDDPVLVTTTYLVEGPKEPVPSFVRLEVSDNR